MKKILTILMVFLMSFFITACGFSDEFWEELYDGIDNIIIDVDEDDLPEQVDEESARMFIQKKEPIFIGLMGKIPIV